MKLPLFSVYDEKTKAFCAPFMAPTYAAAARDFAYAANDKATNVGKYPVDFTLFHVADFDDETGDVTHVMHCSLGLAASFIARNEVDQNV